MPGRWSSPTRALAAELARGLPASASGASRPGAVRPARDPSFGELTALTALAAARRAGSDPAPLARAVAGVAASLPEVAGTRVHDDGRVDLRLRPGALVRWLEDRCAEERAFDAALGDAGLEALDVLAPSRPPVLRRRLGDHLATALTAHPAGRAPRAGPGPGTPDPAGIQLLAPVPEDTPPAPLAAVLVVALSGVGPRETAVLDPSRLLAPAGPGAVRGLLEGYLRIEARVRYLGEPDLDRGADEPATEAGPTDAGADGPDPMAVAFDDPTCRRVAGLVLAFPEVVHGAGGTRGGKALVRYLERVVPQAEALYHLAGLISDDARIPRARALLLAAARDTIWSSLRLLGARVPRHLGRGLQ